MLLISILLANSCFANLGEEGVRNREKIERSFVFLPQGTQKISFAKWKVRVLRPLTEFKVGKKYCLYGSENWDEACQDGAMKYAFGENWNEFKKIIINFIEDIKNNRDIEMDYFAENCAITSPIFSEETHNKGYRSNQAGEGFNTKESVTTESYNCIKYDLERNDIKYKDFIINDFWNDQFYSISINKNITISFGKHFFDENYKNFEYVPKIQNIICE